MARRSALALASALLVLPLLLPACSDPRGRRGRPEYFERITGQTMLMGEPRYECERGSHLQAAAVISYELTPEQMAWFRDPPEVFRQRPYMIGDTDGRAWQFWRTGVPEESEQRLAGQAVATIYYALDGEQCGGRIDIKQAAAELRRAHSRLTSHYAYTTIPQPKDDVLLSWYVIDMEEELFWVIDSSP